MQIAFTRWKFTIKLLLFTDQIIKCSYHNPTNTYSQPYSYHTQNIQTNDAHLNFPFHSYVQNQQIERSYCEENSDQRSNFHVDTRANNLDYDSGTINQFSRFNQFENQYCQDQQINNVPISQEIFLSNNHSLSIESMQTTEIHNQPSQNDQNYIENIYNSYYEFYTPNLNQLVHNVTNYENNTFNNQNNSVVGNFNHDIFSHSNHIPIETIPLPSFQDTFCKFGNNPSNMVGNMEYVYEYQPQTSQNLYYETKYIVNDSIASQQENEEQLKEENQHKVVNNKRNDFDEKQIPFNSDNNIQKSKINNSHSKHSDIFHLKPKHISFKKESKNKNSSISNRKTYYKLRSYCDKKTNLECIENLINCYEDENKQPSEILNTVKPRTCERHETKIIIDFNDKVHDEVKDNYINKIMPNIDEDLYEIVLKYTNDSKIQTEEKNHSSNSLNNLHNSSVGNKKKDTVYKDYNLHNEHVNQKCYDQQNLKEEKDVVQKLSQETIMPNIVTNTGFNDKIKSDDHEILPTNVISDRSGENKFYTTLESFYEEVEQKRNHRKRSKIEDARFLNNNVSNIYSLNCFDTQNMNEFMKNLSDLGLFFNFILNLNKEKLFNKKLNRCAEMLDKATGSYKNNGERLDAIDKKCNKILTFLKVGNNEKFNLVKSLSAENIDKLTDEIIRKSNNIIKKEIKTYYSRIEENKDSNVKLQSELKIFGSKKVESQSQYKTLENNYDSMLRSSHKYTEVTYSNFILQLKRYIMINKRHITRIFIFNIIEKEDYYLYDSINDNNRKNYTREKTKYNGKKDIYEENTFTEDLNILLKFHLTRFYCLKIFYTLHEFAKSSF